MHVGNVRTQRLKLIVATAAAAVAAFELQNCGIVERATPTSFANGTIYLLNMTHSIYAACGIISTRCDRSRSHDNKSSFLHPLNDYYAALIRNKINKKKRREFRIQNEWR